jgi:hypothetical protein
MVSVLCSPSWATTSASQTHAQKERKSKQRKVRIVLPEQHHAVAAPISVLKLEAALRHRSINGHQSVVEWRIDANANKSLSTVRHHTHRDRWRLKGESLLVGMSARAGSLQQKRIALGCVFPFDRHSLRPTAARDGPACGWQFTDLSSRTYQLETNDQESSYRTEPRTMIEIECPFCGDTLMSEPGA